MESFTTLLKILLFLYLGSFTYITYIIFFYFQKKFLIIKTFFYFSLLSILIIKISNKYNITYFIGYSFFYLIGLVLTRSLLKSKILKNTKLVSYFLYIPSLKLVKYIFKKIIFYNFFVNLKKRYKLYKYYKKYPYKKPKTIYELF